MKVKHLFAWLLLIIPFVGYSQETEIKLWSKNHYIIAGQGTKHKKSYLDRINSVKIGYEPVNGLYVLITSKYFLMSPRETSVRLYGKEYDKFKKILSTYSEWRKAAKASNVALKKEIYHTEGDFEFTFKIGAFVDPNNNENKSLNVQYKNGSLIFESLGNSIELNESEMIAIVEIFSNRTLISEKESKLQGKSSSWDSFKPVD
jgi:hypothetical protein